MLDFITYVLCSILAAVAFYILVNFQWLEVVGQMVAS